MFVRRAEFDRVADQVGPEFAATQQVVRMAYPSARLDSSVAGS